MSFLYRKDVLTILSVDPTDGDELIEIGIRKKLHEKLLLIVPVIPEGDKKYYDFCDINNYDETKSYNNAFKMAYWLARCFPDTVVYVERNIVDERNPVSQKIYKHLSEELPKIKGHHYLDYPPNLCLCYNELRMIINTSKYIKTNVGRPCTGFMFLRNIFKFDDKIITDIFVQGGSIYGEHSKTTNIEGLFKRTPRESMNLARNPKAFVELMKIAQKDHIVVVPTCYSKVRDLEDIHHLIDITYPINLYNLQDNEVVAKDILNNCLKTYYKQDRFKYGAKLFDVDLLEIEHRVEEKKEFLVKMKCSIKKNLGEMELHNGDLDNNDEYEHFGIVACGHKNLDLDFNNLLTIITSKQ